MRGRIAKTITQLREDPRHPGLHTEKVRSRPGVFAARIDGGNRLTFRWEDGTIVLMNHCNHKQVLGR